MKKLLAAVLVAMFALGLAACGESTNDLSDPDHILNQDRG